MNIEKQYHLMRYFCITGTIFFGSGSTIISKRLDMIGFYFPLFQTGLMFFGELCCVIFMLRKQKTKSKTVSLVLDSNKMNLSPQISIARSEKSCFEKTGNYGFCISAIFDLLGAFLEYFSYNLLKASVIITFKMIVIVFIWWYRVFLLKKKVYRHQSVGLIFLFIGFIIVGLEVSLQSDTNLQWHKTTAFGIVLMIAAQVFNALNIISEEYLMNKVNITSEKIVAIEGGTGLIICIILYAPIQYLFNILSYDDVMIDEPFKKISNHLEICLLVLSMVIVIGLLNFFLVKTIKVADSLSLCTIDSGRVILVWILSIAFNFEEILPIEIAGGCSLILGICIYNEVVIIPCCGLKKSAKISMKENQSFQELKIKDRMWQYRLNYI